MAAVSCLEPAEPAAVHAVERGPAVPAPEPEVQELQVAVEREPGRAGADRPGQLPGRDPAVIEQLDRHRAERAARLEREGPPAAVVRVNAGVERGPDRGGGGVARGPRRVPGGCRQIHRRLVVEAPLGAPGLVRPGDRADHRPRATAGVDREDREHRQLDTDIAGAARRRGVVGDQVGPPDRVVAIDEQIEVQPV